MHVQPSAMELPRFNKRNYAITRFMISRLARRLDVQIRLHGAGEQFASGGGIIVANHFTRLETFVIPFVLYKELRLTVRIIAAPMFFSNKMFGNYLLSIGALPSDYPDKYDIIARDILHGGWWLIFPEGSMIKDRKVIHRGRFQVSNEWGTVKQRPRSGAAIIALTVQRYRDALWLALQDGSDRQAICQTLQLNDVSAAELQTIADSPTRIVPLNITYYPLNPQDNLIKTLATRLAPNLHQSDMGERILEELTVEGSMLLKGVEIDMRLGDPLFVGASAPHVEAQRSTLRTLSPWRHHLDRLHVWQPITRFARIIDRWIAWIVTERRRMRRRARQMTQDYMQAVYSLTTINMDHLLSGFIHLAYHKYHRKNFNVPELKRRLYLAIQMLRNQCSVHLHLALEGRDLHSRLLTDQPHKGLDSFIKRAVEQNLLTCRDDTWTLAGDHLSHHLPFLNARLQNFMQVCTNEIEPLVDVTHALHHAVGANLEHHQERFVEDLFTYEHQLYKKDYNAFAHRADTKVPALQYGVGRPMLLSGSGAMASVGVLLVHGYSASPGEVLPLARYLHGNGLTVYVVRLRGHGTSPYDLLHCLWQDWYASVLRGYDNLRLISDIQFAGGMSAGGGLSLYLAAQHVGPLQGVFAVGAPIKLHNPYLRLVPLAMAMRDFVYSKPENPRTNYVYQPLRAVLQLTKFIDVYQAALPRVTQPVLLVQARGDTTVCAESAQMIYDRLKAHDKCLIWKDVDRHVIVGDNYPDVHHDILRFLQQHSSLPMGLQQQAG
jgi:esterase/lipase/1-acyl-sn-glycerol-3-phosphate acyltransferase